MVLLGSLSSVRSWEVGDTIINRMHTMNTLSRQPRHVYEDSRSNKVKPSGRLSKPSAGSPKAPAFWLKQLTRQHQHCTDNSHRPMESRTSEEAVIGS
jgi:hypothetical protein